MLVGRRFVVAGRVQGVGFRYFTREAARREGLGGSVRNLDDGGVEIVVEGDAEAVDRFERAIRQGPPGARVDNVLVDLAPATGRIFDFRVLSS
jgi:acylphosphatase